MSYAPAASSAAPNSPSPSPSASQAKSATPTPTPAKASTTSTSRTTTSTTSRTTSTTTTSRTTSTTSRTTSTTPHTTTTTQIAPQQAPPITSSQDSNPSTTPNPSPDVVLTTSTSIFTTVILSTAANGDVATLTAYSTTVIYPTIVPSHSSSNNTGLIAGAAAGAVSAALFFLCCLLWWRHRKPHSHDGTVRITQGGAGQPDLVGAEVTPYHYEPQAGARAEYNSESGPSRPGSGPSGLGAATWSGGSSMQQYPDSQTLLTSNMLEMGRGGGSLATSGSYYPSTPSDSTSMMRLSAAMMGHNSYGSGGTSPSSASPPPQSYRPFSAKEKRQSEATGSRDSEVEVEALQRSDNGLGRILPQIYPSVPGETPHVEVGMVQHTDAGRVPDRDMAVRTPHEIPPSYDSISGNV